MTISEVAQRILSLYPILGTDNYTGDPLRAMIEEGSAEAAAHFISRTQKYPNRSLQTYRAVLRALLKKAA